MEPKFKMNPTKKRGESQRMSAPENAMLNPLAPASRETPAERTARETLAKIKAAEMAASEKSKH